MPTKSLKLALVLALVGGCAHRPPTELATAQSAYDRASSGPAAQVAPDELHRARVALAEAERAANDHPRAPRTLDLIYIAERRAQIADARARTALAKEAKKQAEASYTDTLSQKQAAAQREAEAARAQSSEASARLAAEQQARVDAEQARAEAEQARAEAERKAQLANEDLAKVAQLREDDRGTIIALPGDLLFATGQSTLLSSAMLKLDKVVEALKEGEEKLIIEGHTDSRGTDAYNMDLSRRRAETVRDYLMSHGVAADRFEVVALGESRPLADNRSPEGRANNRRVEIVVEGKHQAAR